MVLSPAHIKAATPVLVVTLAVIAVIGTLLAAGGVYLALHEMLADTKFKLFGNEFASTSVGVAAFLIGVVMVVLTVRAVLRALVQLGKIPGPSKRGED